jgi:hypothetical protein
MAEIASASRSLHNVPTKILCHTVPLWFLPQNEEQFQAMSGAAKDSYNLYQPQPTCWPAGHHRAS